MENDIAVESKECKWFRERYHETPTDGPLAKRVKFGTIQKKTLAPFSTKP